MKWLLLTLLFPLNSYSQVELVNELLIDSTKHQLILYQDNPLRIYASKSNRKFAMSVNGKTIQPNKDGVFVVQPKKLGNADIQVMENGRKVFQGNFSIDSLGGLYARVGRIRDSIVSKQLLLAQPFLTTYWQTENVRCLVRVFGFNFQLISTDGEFRQSQYVQGRSLYPNQVEEVRTAGSGTVLLFYDIMVVASNGNSSIRRIPDIRITIR
jgi:hypothetical protein